MAKRRKSRRNRRRKILFAVEIVVLLLLSLVLFVAIWATQRLSLINRQDLDEDRLFTASEVNGGAAEGGTGTTSNLSGVELIALVGLDTREGEEAMNSDTMIIACLNHNEKTIKLVSVYRDTYLNIGEDYYGNPNSYTKANAAYNLGGPEQFLSMLNLNLDLNITEYVTVDFKALTKTIELLGGIDIDLTREEVIHINNYNRGDDEATGTAEASGVEYEALEVPPEEESGTGITHTYHLNGSQAVSYARIRYTAGNDFRRASRQRLVLAKIMEKAQSADLGTLDAILGEVLPLVTTNLQNTQIISMVQPLLTYSLTEDSQTGFPFVLITDSGGELTGEDCIIPVTLEYNVQRLHEFLFPGESYTPSATVQEYSAEIEYETGYSEEDIEDISTIDWGENLSQWTGE